MKRKMKWIMLALGIAACLWIYPWSVHGQMTPNPERITTIAWSPDGQSIAYGRQNGHLIIYNTLTQQNREIAAHTEQVSLIAWSHDNSKLASSSADTTVRVWEATTGRNLYTFTDYVSPSFALFWTSDDHYLIGGTVFDNYNLQKWDIQAGQLLERKEYGSIFGLFEGPDQAQISALMPAGVVFFLDPHTLQNTRPPLLPAESFTANTYHWDIYSAAWSPDGALLATGAVNGKIRVWELASSTIFLDLQGSEGLATDFGFDTTIIRALRFRDDGHQLISVSSNGIIRSWQVSTGQQLENLQLQDIPLYAAAFSPDGSQLAYGANETRLKVIDMPITPSQPLTVYIPSPFPTLTATPAPNKNDLYGLVLICVQGAGYKGLLNQHLDHDQWQAFIDEVNVQRGDRITEECANDLIDLATFLRP